jgi:hypothetical protein
MKLKFKLFKPEVCLMKLNKTLLSSLVQKNREQTSDGTSWTFSGESMGHGVGEAVLGKVDHGATARCRLGEDAS